MMTTAGHQ